jgi:hypothetical protein
LPAQVRTDASLEDLPLFPIKGPLTTVKVAFSTFNYKDGMVLQGMPGVAKSFPIA